MIMDRGFLFFLLLLEWNWINSARVLSHRELFNPKDLQHIHTTWHRGDVQQSSPRLRPRRQYLPDTTVGELEIPSSNIKKFKVSFTLDLYESTEKIFALLAESSTQLIGKEPFRIIFESSFPQNSTQEYVDKIIQILKTYLREKLPTTSFRSVEVSIQKNKDDSISEATITISVNTEHSQNKYLRVDLSKPNVNIRHAILTTLITKIKAPSLSGDNDKVINVIVKPPFGADNLILQHITNILRHVLMKLTKSSDISINTFSSENSDGSISKITYKITIGLISRFSEHINLDLSKKGSDLSEKLQNILSTLREKFMSVLISRETVTLSLEIQLPIYLTNGLSESYHITILSELQKVFPGYSVIIRKNTNTMSEKLDKGLISFFITIKPKNSIEDIDLSDFDATKHLTEKIKKILTSLLVKINKEYPYGGIAAFNLQVKLPDKLDDILLDNIINQIRMSIIKGLDNEDRSVNLKITEDFLGNIMNLKIDLIIHPKLTEQPDEITVRLDFSTSEDKIEEKLKFLLVNTTKRISQKLIKNLPVHLKFAIQSSEGSDNVFVENVSAKIYRYVSKMYPNNQIKMKVIKDEKENLIEITVLLTILSASHVTLTVNLISSGSDLREETSRIIQNISRELRNYHNEEKPLNIGLDIQVSKNVTEHHIENITNSIVTIITEALPDYLVNVADETILNFRDDVVHLYFLLSIKLKQQIYVLNSTSNGSKMIEEISQILLHVTNQLVEYSTEGQSANFTLNIYPPSKSNEEFVKNTQDSIYTMTQKLFPNYKVTINVKEEKDSKDYVVLIKILFLIQPKLIHKTTSNTILTIAETSTSRTISSTTPVMVEPFSVTSTSSSIPSVVEPFSTTTGSIVRDTTIKLYSTTEDQIKSTHKIENETENDEYPEESPIMEDFLGTARNNTIFDSDLSKDFRDSIGLISRKDEPNIILHIADGSLPHETSDKIFNINLNGSGTIDSTELSKILEILQSDIADELKRDLAVDLKLNIQVPRRITTNSIRKMSQPLIPIIRKFFPKNRIISYEPKKINNRITLGVKIEPAAHIHLNIDLSQTRDNLVDIIHEKLSSVVSNKTFQNNVHNRSTATIVMDIKPQKKKKQEYLQVISEALVLNLKEYFPRSKIYVKIFTKKDNYDYLSEIHILITIGPSNVKYIEKVIDFDLTKNNLNLNEYINGKLPDIIYHVNIHLAEGLSINLNFNIKTYDKSILHFSNQITKKIVGIIKNHFIYNKINVRIKNTDNTQVNIFSIVLKINIEPLTEEQSKNFIHIVLSKYGTNLISQINKTLLNKIPDVKRKLNNGLPVTLYFNVIPPRKTGEKYITIISENVVRALKSFFFQNNINEEIISKKDSRGYLLIIIDKITIKPFSQKDITENVILIDLSKSEDSFTHQINKILKNILPDVKKKWNDKSPVILHFNILLPQKSSEKLLKIISEILTTSLQDYLPSSNIKVEVTSKKNNQGYLNNIIAEVTIRKNSRSESTQNELSIDLSEHEGSISHEIKKILQKSILDIKRKINNALSVTLFINITPPKKSSEKFLKIISETLVTSLQSYLPSTNIFVKVNSVKKNQGYLKNIIAEITIRANSRSGQTRNEIPIDLSEPKTSYSYEINQTLNRILSNVKNELDGGSSATLYFNVIPPKVSSEKFQNTISETLVKYLQRYLPSSNIKLRVTSQKNSHEYLNSIFIEVIIKPNTSNQLRIDLSTPGESFQYQINKILQTMTHYVENKLKNRPFATLYFNIIPPRKSTDKFLKIISETLVTCLKKYLLLRNSKVKVTSQKNSQGFLANILAEIIIKQNSRFKPTPNEIFIDLSKPGWNLSYQIDKILQNIIHDVKEKLNDTSSAKLYFNIIPPSKTSNEFLNVLSETLKLSLKNYLHSCNINMKITPLKNEDRYLTKISVEITITPKQQSKLSRNVLSIDLSKHESSLPREIDKIVQTIIKVVKEEIDDTLSATLFFDVIPPKQSSDSFLVVISDTLITTLQNYLPTSKISVNLTSQRSSQGHLTNVFAEVNIQQNPQYNQLQREVTIDLSEPGINLLHEINKKTNRIIDDIKNNLNNASTTTLFLNLKPPKKISEKLLNVIADSLVTSLKVYFPSNKIDVKVTSRKNSQGYLTNISIKTNIKPNPQKKQLQKRLSIDLSQPGANTSYEINRALNEIINNVKKELKNKSTAILYFNVIPPKKSKDKLLNIISDTLVISLQNYLPSYHVNVKVKSQKNSQGHLTNIEAETIILENPQTKQPQNAISINLSQPGANTPYEVNKVLNKIIDDVKKKLANKSSATFYFNVIPPNKSSEEIVNIISETLITSLQNLLPSYDINVRVKPQRNSQGYLTHISAETNITPNPTQRTSDSKKLQEGLSIDLSHTGANSYYEINKVLNEIMNDVRKKLKSSSSLTLYFNVKPPKKSNDQLVSVISETLHTSLQNLLPSYNINVKLQSQRNSQGQLTNIYAETNIKPNPSISPIQNGIYIYLSQPGANIPYEVNKVLNKILNDVKKKLQNSMSATIYFNIIPPEKASEKFLNVLSETLVTSLQNLLPSCNINVKIQSQRNSQGQLTNIYAETNIKQNPSMRPIQNGISINLSQPGANIPYEVNKVLNEILNDVKKKLQNSTSATIYFNIIPPEKATDKFLNVLSETLVTSLQNLLPSSDINVKIQSQRNSQGQLTNIHAETNIKQNPSMRPIQNGISINLSQPGANIPYEVNKVLNEILNDVKKKLQNSTSATIYFNIIPPEKASEKFLEVLSKTLVTSMQNLLPSCNMNVKIQSQRNSQGQLTNIYAETNIKPNPSITPIQNGISINLSQPGANIPYEVSKVLNKILNDVKKKLQNSTSATIYFNIIPPEKASEKFLNVLSETLVTSLQNLLPSSDINVKIQSQRNSQGQLTNIHAETNIKPNPSITPIQNGISINLSQPGTNIPYEVNKVLNKILNDVKKKLQNSTSATIYFNIIPPEKASDKFLNVLSETLVTSLQNLLPSSNINVKIQSQRNSQGQLTNIHAETNIKPNPSITTIQNGIFINLSQPGANIPYEVNKVLNKILNDIKKKLQNSTSATIYFNIIPPEKATDKFLNVLSETLVTSVQNLLPSSNINVKIQSQRNSQGQLTNIHAETNIKPNPSITPIQNGISINLSQPGANIPFEVNKVLNKILNDVKKKLQNSTSATIFFNILPPEEASDEFLNVLSETLATSLQNLLPSSGINVKIQSQRNSQGQLTNIHAETNIKPNPSITPIQNEISINLSQPGANIPYEVNKVLNKILNDVKKKLQNSTSATIYFNIIPPEKATDKFLNVLSETLVTSLQNLLPSCNINVRLQLQRNSKGELTNIHAETNIKPNPSITPTQNGISINLSQPGANIPYEVNKVLNKILNDVKKKLQNSTSATIYFNIIPPEKASDEFLNGLSETLVTSLQNLLPSCNINVKIQSQRNNQGQLTNIHAETNIKPNPSITPIQNGISINLSQPGANIPYEVNKVLNKILNDVKKKLQNSTSATIYFNIIPPKKASEKFLNVLSETLVTSLQNLLPSCNINVKIQSQRNNQGQLTNIHAETNIKPNTSITPIQNGISINLSQPGANIPYEVNKVLNKILNDVKKKLQNSTSATIYFNIIPPEKATDKFLNVLSETLVTSLQNLLPSCNINVKIQSQRNNQGQLTNIHAETNIKPNPSITPIQNGISINLSQPGANIPYEVNKVLNKILNDVKKKLQNSTSATIYFNIIPPEEASEKFLNRLSETLVTSLQNLLPSCNINVRLQLQRNSKGELTNIHAETNIKPNPSITPTQNGISINLSQPGANIPYEVNKVLNKILNDVKKKLQNSTSATIYFNIIPPEKASDEFLNGLSETLVTSLQNLLPSCNINVKIQSQRNNQGQLTNIHAETNIKPNPSITPIQNGISINLSQPGANIPYEVNKVLNKILNDVKKKLQNSTSATIYFNIIPPKEASEEFLNVLSETLVTSLQNLLPSCNINVKIQSQRNNQGQLTNIHAETNIKPNPSITPIQNGISINLSQPGANIPYEVNKVLNKILNDVKKKLQNSTSATIYFNIIPPKEASEKFLNVLSETLVTSLQNLLPSCNINVKIQSQRNNQGQLTNIHAETNIKPNPSITPIQNGISINLSQPGANIPYEVNKVLNKILNDVKKKLQNSTSATIYFNIIPPEEASEKFLNGLSKTLVTSLQNLLPSCNINVRLQLQRNSQGQLTNIHAETNIKPNPSITPTQNGISINLSQPGANIPYEVNKVLNKILNDVKKKLQNSTSATIYFNIIPPEKASDEFLNGLSETLVTSLQNLLPSCNINVRLQLQRNSQGQLTNIHAETNIKPNPSITPIQNGISINLSQPGANIPYEVNKVLNKILNDVKKKLQNSTSATIYFNILPPEKASDKFLNVLSETLVTSLQNLLPSSDINVKIQSQRNNQGQLTNIHAETNIKPNPSITPIQNGISINLSQPGANIPYEVNKVLNKILNDVKKKLQNSTSATIYFNIIPPEKASDEFLNGLSETLDTSLQNLLPSCNINVRLQLQRNSQGQLTNIHAETNIKPNPSITPIQNGISINLSQPGANIPYEVNKVLNKILNDVKKKLLNSTSATIYFNIIPPKEASEKFLNVLSETLVTSLQNLLPSCNINVKIQSQRNNQGQLTNIHAETNIKPNPSITPIQNGISINLSQPGANIPYEVNKVLNKILNDVKKKLQNSTSATIYFNIIPPKEASEKFLNVLSETLVTSLQNLLPSCNINVKIQSQRNNQGQLTNIHAETNIKPNPSITPIQNGISINLSQPGANIPYEVNKVLNKILNDVKKKLQNSTSANIYFNIIPPAEASEKFLKGLSKTLVTSLQNLLPSCNINVRLQLQRNSQGQLTNIHAETNITPNPSITPIQNGISIDLSQPGANIPYEVNKVLNKIMNDVKKKLQNSTSATIYFNIIPPEEASEKFLNGLSETLVTSLQNLLPSCNINVRLELQRNSQGQLTNIHAETNIKPNPSITPIQNGISINLSQPGANIPYEVNKVLNKILNDVKKKLQNSTSATIYFNIIPPKKASEKFLNVLSETLVTSLQNLLPSCNINVKIQSQRNNQGQLTNIHAETNIKPNPSITPIQNGISINLSQPGANIPHEVNRVLNKILNDVKKKLQNSTSATIYFNIIPPEEASEKFLNGLSETLVTSLQNLLPSCNINVRLELQRNSQGQLTNIHAETNIKPNPSITPIQNGISINLSQPGANIPYEVNKVLNKILNDVKKKLQNSTSATIYFNIKPPKKAKEKFLNVLSETLVTSLQNLLPSCNINVKVQSQRNNQGQLTNIYAETNIKPNPSITPIQNGISINLSQPGANIPYEVNKVLNKILNDVKKKLQNSTSATIHFNIIPPEEASEKFLNGLSETLVTSLQNLLPSCNINVRLELQRNSQGQLTNIHAETNIKPNPSITPIQNGISINLSQPGANIPYEVNKVLNKILNDVKKKLQNSTSATIYFNIKPPKKAKEKFLNVLSETLVTSLQNLLPSCNINVKVQSQRNNQGQLTNIYAETNIKPNPSITPIQNGISINLSQPGANIPYEVNKVLNEILNDVKKKLQNSTSATIYFNIIPPEKASEKFLNGLSETLVTSLQNLLPSCNINVRLELQRNSQGQLTNIHAETNIKPNPSITPIQNGISINLSQPGANIPYEVNKVLNKILNDVKKKLQNSTSATIYFNIKPPKKAKEKFLNVLSETLVTSLQNLLPSCNINVKIQSQRNNQGQLTNIYAETNIKPNPSITPIQNGISINLSQPGANIPYEVNKVLNKILNDVKKKLQNSTSATIYFNIIPPEEASEKFLNGLSETLVTSLQNLLPSCNINVRLELQRNSQGQLTNIHAETNIKPNPSITPIQNGISINLSQPGANIPYEVNKVLNKILNDVKKKLQNSTSATIYFNIIPPKEASEKFLNVLSETLVTSLQNLLPSCNINVKIQSQRNNQGQLTNIHAETNIKPNPSITPIQNGISINLSQPGANIPYEVNKVLNKILNDVKKKLQHSTSATIYFNIIPPEEASEKFLNGLSETLVTSLQNLLPSCNINVRLELQRNSQGQLTNIHAETNIKPNPSITPIQNGISINLSQPGANIPYEVNKVLNKILNDVKKKLQNSTSATIYFNIIPPKKVSEKFLNVLSETLVTSLQNLLPSCNINVKVQSQRNTQGQLTNIYAETNIKPNPSITPIQNGISINLSQPGANIPYEVNKVLNKILNDVKKKLQNSTSATIYFNIIPPEEASEKFLNGLSETLVTSLQNLLPSCNINVRLELQRNSQGQLTNIYAETNIKPNPSITPIQNGISINLSQPGANIPYEVNKFLNKILNDVKKKLQNSTSATIYFNISPPEESSDKFLNVLSETLVTSLQNLLPSSDINVKIQSQRNSQGQLTNIYAETNIKPNPSITPIQNGISIDLSQPGSNIPYEVNKILNKILNDVKKKLQNSMSATLFFNIIPPEKASEKFLNVLSETLVTSLQNLLPSCNINVRLQLQRNSQGQLTNIHAETNIKSIGIPQIQTVISINLSQPVANTPYEVNTVLNKIIYDVKKKLENSSSTALYFNVIPPDKSSEKFLDVLSETLVTSLQNLLPSCEIHVKLKSERNSEGYLTNIQAETTIKRIHSIKQKQNGITIDLSKTGSNLRYEINKILPSILNNVKKKLNDSSSATLFFNIIAPHKVREKFINGISETLLTSFQSYLPSYNIDVKITSQKNSQGYLRNISAEIIIRQIYQSKEFQNALPLDLSKPGTNLPYEINKILHNILHDINKKLIDASPATVYFNIIPPNRAREKFLNVISQTLVTSFQSYFPSCNIDVKVTSQKNSRGYLTNILVEITIEPYSHVKQYQNGLPIDLSKPGSSLSNEIDKILQSIINDIKRELKDASTATLYFNIVPPHKVREKFLNLISGTLVISFQSYLPSYNIDVKVTSQKNSYGYLTNIFAETTIKPNLQNEQFQKGIPIDLSKPGVTLFNEINKILQGIINDVRKELNDASSTSLYFNIIPPKQANEILLNIITETLVTSMQRYLPSCIINVEVTSQKNSQGYLMNIFAEITIKQNSQSKQYQNVILIDLSKPGSSLNYEINQIVQSIIHDVKNKLNDALSTTIYFNVKPPKKSSEKFVNVISKLLVIALKSYLKTEDIKVQIDSHINDHGYLRDVTLIVNIQPLSHNKPYDKEIVIDLSKHDVDFIYLINESLFKVLSYAKNYLNDGSSIMLRVQIIPPPKSQTNFIKRISDLILAIFHKYLPMNNVTLNTNSQKNYHGFLSKISVEINIQPHNAYIDLSKSEIALKQQLDIFLSRIKNTVNNDIRHGHSVILTFNIKPPKKSTQFYHHTTLKSLMSIVTSYFPKGNVVETIATKNNRDYLEKITTKVRVTRSVPQTRQTKVDLPLSEQQRMLAQVVNQALPDLIVKLNNELQTSNLVTLNFKVEPPKEVNQDYLEEIPETLVRILTVYFPHYRINVSGSTPNKLNGHLRDIALKINIETSQHQGPKLRYKDIDISGRAATLFDEVNESFFNMSENLKSGSGLIELNVDIRSVNKIDTSLFADILNIFASSFSKYFPKSQAYLKTKFIKDPKVKMHHLIVKFIVEKTPITKCHINDIIDLSQSNPSIRERINRLITSREIENCVNKGESVSLFIKFRPYSEIRGKSIPKHVMNDAMEIISNHFPVALISMNNKIYRNEEGFIENILKITIRPISDRYRNQLTIDFDPLPTVLKTVKKHLKKMLPRILRYVKKALQKNEPISLLFKIKPTTWMTTYDWNKVWAQIVPLLSKYFTQNQIDVKTHSNKESFNDIIITIHPFVETRFNERQVKIKFDFSSPGFSPATKMIQILPELIANTSCLGKCPQTVVNFEITPPKRFIYNFPRSVINYLIPYVTNIFPGRETIIVANTNENRFGEIQTIHVMFNILTSN